MLGGDPWLRVVHALVAVAHRDVCRRACAAPRSVAWPCGAFPAPDDSADTPFKW